MPSLINATTTNGLVTSADNSGSLQLQTNNGTTAVTIDTSQNVGIGTTSPASKLDISTGSSTGTTDMITLSGLDNGSAKQTYGVIQMGIENNTASSEQGNILLQTVESGTVRTRININGSGYMAFSNGGTERMRIDSSGNLLTGGLTSSPGQADPNSTAGQVVALNTKRELRWNNTNASIYGGSGGADDNLYYYSGLSHVFRAAGAERMRLDSLGSLMLNTTNGYGVSGGIYAPAVFNFTTASAANMFIESGGFFRRSTSSIKYKTDVQDATYGLADVMKLRPVTYKGINDGEKVFGGLIAEEVHDAGLTEFVQYAEDGSPDALAYGQMVSLLAKAIQELKAELNEVRAELDATKAEVQALKEGKQ